MKGQLHSYFFHSRISGEVHGMVYVLPEILLHIRRVWLKKQKGRQAPRRRLPLLNRRVDQMRGSGRCGGSA